MIKPALQSYYPCLICVVNSVPALFYPGITHERALRAGGVVVPPLHPPPASAEASSLTACWGSDCGPLYDPSNSTGVRGGAPRRFFYTIT